MQLRQHALRRPAIIIQKDFGPAEERGPNGVRFHAGFPDDSDQQENSLVNRGWRRSSQELPREFVKPTRLGPLGLK